jgi:predicted ABC-type transport system involved in lysophospholipase L1 biosynthesis ATPase subunit/GNAT superfamily N-acetyltransferase
MRPVYEVKVEVDVAVKEVAKSLDYVFTGKSTFEGWEKPEVAEGFSIGLIVGPSGSGKSLLLSQFGKENKVSWEKDKAIVSQFNSVKDAIDTLMAVGLNSVPSWCRPYHVLSTGEQFRADLARRLHDNAVVDEFTSVVDRNVAKSASCGLRRYVDHSEVKGLVLASCHSDIIPWLRPDWYFDTSDGTLHDGRSLRRPQIKIRVYPCKRSVWPMFAKHHYLIATLSGSCDTYLATASFSGATETIVGFISCLPQPFMKNAYREHRTVVLPDFQGLGIGPRISDAVAQMYVDRGKRYFSKTAHIRFGGYREVSDKWKATCKNKSARKDIADKLTGLKKDGSKRSELGKDYTGSPNRMTFSHEYIGG